MNVKEKGYSTFEFQTMLQAKTLLIAIAYTGRYLLFPQYRFGRWRKWFYGASIFLVFGMNLYKLVDNFDWLYLFWLTGDGFLWAMIPAAVIEVMGSLFIYWNRIYTINVDIVRELWQKAWQTIFYLGIWLTLIIGLIYFYLVNFFIIDTVTYSYFFAILLAVTGISLYATVQSKVNEWVNRENRQIDLKMTVYLNWQELSQAELEQNISFVQYLLMLRDYYLGFKKPVISMRTILLYLCFEGAILILPYIIGVVVEV